MYVVSCLYIYHLSQENKNICIYTIYSISNFVPLPTAVTNNFFPLEWKESLGGVHSNVISGWRRSISVNGSVEQGSPNQTGSEVSFWY